MIFAWSARARSEAESCFAIFERECSSKAGWRTGFFERVVLEGGLPNPDFGRVPFPTKVEFSGSGSSETRGGMVLFCFRTERPNFTQ